MDADCCMILSNILTHIAWRKRTKQKHGRDRIRARIITNEEIVILLCKCVYSERMNT